MLARPLVFSLALQRNTPTLLLGEMPLSATGVLQIIAAIFSTLTAIATFVLALQRWPAIADLWKSKQAIIADKNRIASRLLDMTVHADLARQSAMDMKLSLDEIRKDNLDMRNRLEALEAMRASYDAMRPVYDANLAWTPVAFQYLIWLETLAQKNDLDLGGREMPPLPAILVEYFKANKNG